MAKVSNCRAKIVGQLPLVSRLNLNFGFFLGVCFEGIVLRSDGGAAKQLAVVEVQGWEIGGGEGGYSSRG